MGMEGGDGVQTAHQVLHDRVCDVELEGARTAHVCCVAEVVDGEVHREYPLVDLLGYSMGERKSSREDSR